MRTDNHDATQEDNLKLLIIGATGNSGRRIADMALADGHQVSVLVRSRDKLVEQHSGELPDGLIVIEGNATNRDDLIAAMTDQEAVINAAGSVFDGESFLTLIETVVDAAESALGNGGRLWVFGGAAVLDAPGGGLTVDLPNMPPVFAAHKTNYERLQRTALDWSMICPGPMNPANADAPRKALRVSVNAWPVDVSESLEADQGSEVRDAESVAAAFQARMPEMVVTYEDMARVVLDNLAAGGPFSRARVGLALPLGETDEKDFSA